MDKKQLKRAKKDPLKIKTKVNNSLSKSKSNTEEIIIHLKKSLNDFIKRNKSNVFLTGNKRFNYKSGNYYIRNKKVLTSCPTRSNLISPIPFINNNVYQHKMSTYNQMKAERTAVFLRRIEYSQEIKSVNIINKYKNKLNKIVQLQLWWKIMFKLIKLQAFIKGFLFRKILFEKIERQNSIIKGLIQLREILIKKSSQIIYDKTLRHNFRIFKLTKIIVNNQSKAIRKYFCKWIICYINYKILLKCIGKFNGHILKYIKNKCFYKLKIKTNLHSNNEKLIDNKNSLSYEKIQTETKKIVMVFNCFTHSKKSTRKIYENKINKISNKFTFYLEHDTLSKLPKIQTSPLFSKKLNLVFQIKALLNYFNKQKVKKVKSAFNKWITIKNVISHKKQSSCINITYYKKNNSNVTPLRYRSNSVGRTNKIFKKPKIIKRYIYVGSSILYSTLLKWNNIICGKYSNKSLFTISLFLIIRRLIKAKQNQNFSFCLPYKYALLFKIYKHGLLKNAFSSWKSISPYTYFNRLKLFKKQRHCLSVSAKKLRKLNSQSVEIPFSYCKKCLQFNDIDVKLYNKCNNKIPFDGIQNYPRTIEFEDMHMMYTNNNNSVNTTNITSFTDSFMTLQSSPIKTKIIHFNKK